MNLSEEMEGCSETRIELGEYKDGFENRQDHRVWEERTLELPSTPSTREEDVGAGKHEAAEVEMENEKGGREREDAVSARSIRSQRWQRHAVTVWEGEGGGRRKGGNEGGRVVRRKGGRNTPPVSRLPLCPSLG